MTTATLLIADVIYCGDIITMDEKSPTAEAVAVKDGLILAVGTKADVLKAQGVGTQMIDLGSKTMLPGFIDGHSHFFQAAMIADYANVSAPPVGTAGSIAGIIAVLKDHVAKKPLKPGEWLIGYGYDGSAMSDGRDATRDDFDPYFPSNPMVLVHVSGHGCVLNSAGFKAVGIDASTPTPPGGVTVRKPGSNEPAGLLMENSMFPILLKLPKPSPQLLLEHLTIAQQMYASNGYTTVQDAPVEPKVMPLYQKAADEGRLFLDLNGYWESHAFLSSSKPGADYRSPTANHYRLAGVKVIADGSPQGRTAFFSKPYLTGGPGGEKNWCGTPIVPPEHLNAVVKLAYEYDAQVLVHCNGDAAIDMLLDAHQAAGAPEGRRTTVVHSQFVRRDQLDLYVKYGINPSFFTNHAFFWGDVHIENLGQERAFFMSPMKTARWLGLHMTNHSDFLVTPLDPLFILWTAVNRTSRSGQIIGPDERISVLDGLKALTIDGAHQYFEESRKGSITAGKLADLVILSANPMKVAASTIKDIKAEETIKDGKSVFQRETPAASPPTAEPALVGAR
ncbi:MAG TPA: amidohydrolase family protein [Candidatus Limnocylindrales bacterium]|jgi:predicted amidohydrolase YtcJ|nr:amidohydrolase family protein [Candidatus Limnocylindrales bacterium]